jgi:amidohydrolase
VRSFDPALRARIPELMERVIAGVTAAHGARHRWEYERGYHAVINDPKANELVRRAVVRALGRESLVDATPTMGAEDFSAYQQRVPGAFFFIGARNEALGIIHPHHHECFDIDERALDHGTRIFVATATELLAVDGDEG